MTSSSSKKYSLLKTSLNYQTKQFFDHSTLHGVRYIAEEDRPFGERFLWFCCTSVGGVITLIIIVSLWEKFQTNPTITGLDTDFHNWDVEFPAIAVCQDDPINDSLVDDLIESQYSGKHDKVRLKHFIRLLGSFSYKNLNEFKDFVGDNDLPQTDLRSIAVKVVNKCEDVFFKCMWKEDDVPCCSKFFPVFTENGPCYAFNLKSLDRDWPDSRPPEFQQEYIFETDARWAIFFNARNAVENPVDVYVHSSEEQTGIDMEPQHKWNRRIVKMAFSSKSTYTTEDAKQLSIKQRRCVFSDEVKLITNDVYTYASCMRECRIKLAFKNCKCIPYFYQKIDKYPYCDLKGMECLIKIEDKLTSKEICPCELGCSNTVYEVEKLNEVSEKGPENASVAEEHSDPLEVGFVSWPMIRYKREVLFGWVDLLVAFGGIAGLFLGFSLLSGVEILYYFTMRSCCMFLRDQKMLEDLEQEYQKREKPPLDLSLVPTFMRKENKQATNVRTIAPMNPAGFPNNNAFNILHTAYT